MGTAVMISIKPKWVDLIVNGNKTIEIRKTKPKLETPFKCYIYETKGDTDVPVIYEDGSMDFHGRGMVVGEFMCVRCSSVFINAKEYDFSEWPLEVPDTRLSVKEIIDYIGDMRQSYWWYISDLKMYDKPKPLFDFQRVCSKIKEDCGTCKRLFPKKYDCIAGLTRPPQSWCYVEEVQ